MQQLYCAQIQTCRLDTVGCHRFECCEKGAKDCQEEANSGCAHVTVAREHNTKYDGKQGPVGCSAISATVDQAIDCDGEDWGDGTNRLMKWDGDNGSEELVSKGLHHCSRASTYKDAFETATLAVYRSEKADSLAVS